MSDRSRGLYRKYDVDRVDGKPLKGGGCIVLEFGDPNAWPAIKMWCATVEAAGYRALAAEVRHQLAAVKQTTQVGPHDFTPLNWMDRLRCRLGDGILARCSACYHPRDAHPVNGWVPSRPLGDIARDGS